MGGSRYKYIHSILGILVGIVKGKAYIALQLPTHRHKLLKVPSHVSLYLLLAEKAASSTINHLKNDIIFITK